jgi:hypothetical protein
MATFVPGFLKDVFISYARVAEKEWVPGFVEKLQTFLDQELAADGAAEIFFDRSSLNDDDPLTEEITLNVTSTATFVIVLSRAYLKREWCRKELSAFLHTAGPGHRRAFIVLIENIPPDERGAPIRQLDSLGFQFWAPHPESDKPEVTWPLPLEGERFDARIRELAGRIAARLKELAEAANQNAGAPPTTLLSRSRVFVADGLLTPDLQQSISSVRAWLADQKVAVLPAGMGALYETFSNDPAGCLAQANEWLSQSTLFIQLLGRQGDADGFERWLLERALASGKVHGRDLIQWRPKELTREAIRDPEHSAFAFGENVIRCDRDAELKPLIRDRLEQIEREKQAAAKLNGAGGGARAARGKLLVDADDGDDVLRDRLFQELSARNIAYHYACNDLGEFKESALSDQFDGLVVTFGECDPKWLGQRFSSTRAVWLRSSPRPRIGVYRAPGNVRPLPTRMESFHDISSDTPDSLENFIARVLEVAQ